MGGEVSGIWLGASDLAKEGHFVWDSSKTALNFTYWSPYENGQVRRNDHDCVSMTRNNGTWTDQVCRMSLAIVCEKIHTCGSTTETTAETTPTMISTSTTPSTTTTTLCNSNYKPLVFSTCNNIDEKYLNPCFISSKLF